MKGRILVVDDERLTRETLDARLGDEGHEVRREEREPEGDEGEARGHGPWLSFQRSRPQGPGPGSAPGACVHGSIVKRSVAAASTSPTRKTSGR